MGRSKDPLTGWPLQGDGSGHGHHRHLLLHQNRGTMKIPSESALLLGDPEDFDPQAVGLDAPGGGEAEG